MQDASVSSLPFTSTTLLNSVHLQFLAGCFGLGMLNADLFNGTQLYHYQVRNQVFCPSFYVDGVPEMKLVF